MQQKQNQDPDRAIQNPSILAHCVTCFRIVTSSLGIILKVLGVLLVGTCLPGLRKECKFSHSSPDTSASEVLDNASKFLGELPCSQNSWALEIKI